MEEHNTFRPRPLRPLMLLNLQDYNAVRLSFLAAKLKDEGRTVPSIFSQYEYEEEDCLGMGEYTVPTQRLPVPSP